MHVVNGMFQVDEGAAYSRGDRSFNIRRCIKKVIIFLGDDGYGGAEVSLESHISPSVLLGRLNRVRMWDERGRSSGSGGSGRCSLNRPNFFGPEEVKRKAASRNCGVRGICEK